MRFDELGFGEKLALTAVIIALLGLVIWHVHGNVGLV